MEKYPGKKNTAVFISGRGSNLKSLIKYSKKKNSLIKITLVISNNPDAEGLKYASKSEIEIYGIKNKSNQMLDLALSDYNTKVTVNHMDNQSLLLQARGRGELFKGKLTARAEYMKATGSLLTMGYESDKQGRLVIL